MAKKRKFTSQAVKDFLNTTGFPFEWEIKRLLEEKNWGTANMSFLDLEENKKREIDIIASKTINNIDIYLIIECKFSKRDSWIFFSPGEEIIRYHSYFACSPYPSKDSFKKIAYHLRIFDSTEPTAINFKTYNNDTNKQSNDSEVIDALYKVVKALIYFYSNSLDSSRRQIYFPIILFSGPIFSASYNRKVHVKKTNYVQFPFEFESDAYIDKEKEPNNRILNKWIHSHNFNERWKIEEIKGIKQAYSTLLNEHLIEFVSGAKFKAYLSQLESEISKIDINLWPVEPGKK